MMNDRWRSLQPLVLAGRMPLTNYLLQTIIATFIFYGWGLGRYEQTGATTELILALAIFFGIQVPLSRLRLSVGDIRVAATAKSTSA